MNPQKNKELFLMHALQHTTLNTYISLPEFRFELKRFRSIRKAIIQYDLTGNIKLPLFITHFVVLHNMFPTPIFNQFLFSEVPNEHWSILKTTLTFLNLLIQEKSIQLLTTPKVRVNLYSIAIDKEFLRELENSIKSIK